MIKTHGPRRDPIRLAQAYESQQAINAAKPGAVWQHGDHVIAKTPEYDPGAARALRTAGFRWQKIDRVWTWFGFTPTKHPMHGTSYLKRRSDADRAKAIHAARRIMRRYYTRLNCPNCDQYWRQANYECPDHRRPRGA